MKRTVLITALLLAAAFASNAQMTADYYKNQYVRQVRNLGAAGVGVETILERWAEAYPEDCDMLEGRFAYYLAKSQESEIVMRDERKYLGLKPTLELKDSLGVPHYYFQVPVYVDSLFALSASAIEKAISLKPEELKYRVDKITALIAYEGESPDMAEAEVMKLIDMNASHTAWTYDGQPQDDGFFQDLVQEYCYSFFSTGTSRSYDAFFKISEKMSKLYPKTAVYISNIGSYWFVAKNNTKKAQSFYKKALKIDPEDFAANRNMKLINQPSQSQKGRPSK